MIQIADNEKMSFKNLSKKQVREYGEENIKDMIACGFNMDKTFIFYNSEYIQTPFASEIINDIANSINLNKIMANFGLKENDCAGKYLWTLYQTAAAFSQYYHQFEKKKIRCLVVYSIDQDPYFRMARDIAPKINSYKPCAIIGKFLIALEGIEKMSSSNTNIPIYMSDTKKQIETKIKRYAFSGGQETLELHRQFGANLEVDVAYKYLEFFEPDDEKYKRIGQQYQRGEITTSEIKKYLCDVLTEFIKNHQKNRT